MSNASCPIALDRLNISQIKPAARMLSRAFEDYPLFTYFIPDQIRRHYQAYYILEFMLRYGIFYGEAYTTSSALEGIAVWLPQGKVDMSPWRTIWSGGLSLVPKLGLGTVSRMEEMNDFITFTLMRYAPARHWYLSPLGIDPMYQGKGYAGRLLRPMLARTDKEGVTSLLHTHTTENVSFYEHFGFHVVECSMVPGTKFVSWAMMRKAVSVAEQWTSTHLC